MKRVFVSLFIICFLFALFSDSSLCSLCRPAADDGMAAVCAKGGETSGCAGRCMAERTAPTVCGAAEADTPSRCGGCSMARAKASRPPCAQATRPVTEEQAVGIVAEYTPSSRCSGCVLSRLHKGFTFYRVADPEPGLDVGDGRAFITKHAELNHTYINETPINSRIFPTTVLRC